MRLCGFIVLLLGLGFLLAVLSPQSMRASPVCMPITACAALASQVENIRVISSDQLDAAPMGGMRFRVQASRLISAFRGDAKHAPRLFSTSPNASKALDQSGNVGIGSTAPTQALDVAGSINLTGNVTTAASFTIANTATTVNIAASPATSANQTVNFASGTVDSGYTHTVNIMSSPYSNGTYVLNLGSQNYGNPSTININGAVNINSYNTGSVFTTTSSTGVAINSGQSNGWRAFLQFQNSGTELGAVGLTGTDGTVRLASIGTTSPLALQTNSNDRLTVTTSGNVGIVFTSPFSAPPIASIAAATQAAFPNLSGQAKRNQNPAHGMVTTAAARDLGHLFRVRLNQKAV